MTTRAMRVWFGVFVALVFVVGAGTGVVLAPRFTGMTGNPPFPSQPPGFGPGRGFRPGGPMPAALVERLADELQLDTSQRQRLEAVLEQRRARLQGFNREVRERFETEQRELRREISDILTPAQQQRFDEFLRRSMRRGPWWLSGGSPRR